MAQSKNPVKSASVAEDKEKALATALANIENTYFGGSYDTEKITTCALFHDCAEIITGDLPTPVKYKHEAITGAYSQVEGAAKKTLLDSLDPKLQKKYFEYLKTEKNIVTNVKLIEKAENQYFSVAAASIIARYQLIKEFDKLSLNEGIKLPKGAGSKVDTIIERIYKTKGEKYLYNIGKCNFKNLEKVKAKI